MPALSVLDLSPIPSGASAGEALRATIQLAQYAETLGAKRFWVAEHHNAGSLASSAPEILIGQIAAVTGSLRVGSGGIMLLNHSALHVAESFRVLEALFPGRIDLGLGRAPGTDPRTARALRRGLDLGPEVFPEQLRSLISLLSERRGPRPPRPADIIAVPAGVGSPELFLLSSSDYGAAVAGELGLGFAFAHHMSPRDAVSEIARYRAAFRPSQFLATPYAIASMNVIVGSSDEEATELASSGRLALLRMMQGQRDLPLPSVEEALAYPYDDDERAVLAAFAPNALVGSQAQVRAELCAFVEASRVDEIMVLAMIHDAEARRRSLGRVAEIVRTLA